VSGVIQDGWAWAIGSWVLTVVVLFVYAAVIETRLRVARKEEG
jgi:hypothetical protein